MARILEARARQGVAISVLDERPRLEPDDQFFEFAFERIHRRRRVETYPPAPLSVREILDWLDAYGFIDSEYRSEFVEVISAIDDEWITDRRREALEDRDAQLRKAEALGDTLHRNRRR